MILEELADVVWDCLVKKKPLQTMIMTRKRLKELEEKIKEDAERLEREKKELEEHKRKDNLVSKGVKLKKIDSFSWLLLTSLFSSLTFSSQIDSLLRHIFTLTTEKTSKESLNKNLGGFVNESESEIALTETTEGIEEDR